METQINLKLKEKIDKFMINQAHKLKEILIDDTLKSMYP